MKVKAFVLVHIVILAGTLAMGGPLSVGFSSGSYTVAEEAGTVTITVQMTGTSGKTVTVDYAVSNGSATGGLDYTSVSGTVSIPPDQTVGSFDIPILDDAEPELDETINLVLSNPVNAKLGAAAAVLTILDVPDGDPAQPPQAVITSPEDQSTISAGDLITMDGSTSTVPAGFQVWFAALEANSGSPMTLAYQGAGLSESFTSGVVDGYVIRLVIAEPAAMPSDTELRGLDLPCTDTTACDSTEVSVQITTPPALHSFELVHVFPEVVMVRWPTPPNPIVERSSDLGQTWIQVTGSEPLGSNHLRDVDGLVPGSTVYYRMKDPADGEWSYLGNTSATPGQPVHIPSWTAPRVVPILRPESSFVEWTGVPDATQFGTTGTLHLLLEPEPGQSLAGCVVNIYLNEETFQVVDGVGSDPYVADPVEYGRDEPGCVVRKEIPDVTVVVPPDQDHVFASIPGVVYGGNSLRFEVTDPFGGFSERALLIPLQGEFVPAGEFGFGPDLYPHAPYRTLFFGEQFGNSTPIIRGIGPSGRLSPDCRDLDRILEGLPGSNSSYVVTFEQYYDNDSSVTDSYRISTDEEGKIEQTTERIPSGTTTVNHWLGSNSRWVGREILDSNGTTIANELFVVGVDEAQIPTALTYDRSSSNPAPALDYVPNQVDVLFWTGIGSAVVRFRILDSYHDVDVGTIFVTNESLASPVTVPAYFAEDQFDDAGDWGWMVAEIPMEVGAPSTLRFEAQDLAGQGINETRTVSAAPKSPQAVISSPTAGDLFVTGQQVVMDGTGSTYPSGSSIWFAALIQGSGDPMVPVHEGATLQESMISATGVDAYVIRLVVSDPNLVPTDAELRGAVLPCEGSSTCSATEVVINRHPPEANIVSPAGGTKYDIGETVILDGSDSVVPDGGEVWFAALVGNSGDPMTEAHSQTSLQGQFLASGSDDSYVIRLVVSEPGMMPFEPELRSLAPPCAAVTSCSSTEVVITRKIVDAVINSPVDGYVFSSGEEIVIDGTASTVPVGFSIWMAALVDGSGPPMDTDFVSAALQGSFTPLGENPRYVIRLVIAADGSMPSDQVLRGSELPCAATEECDSAQIAIVQSYDFEEVYSFPRVSLLRWKRTAFPHPTIENAKTPTSTTWTTPDCGDIEEYYYLEHVYDCEFWGAYVPGPYYRIAGSVYLGGGPSPGDPVSRPSWYGPQVSPVLVSGFGSTITWDIPEGAAPFQAEGTLQLKLVGQEGESLAGKQIEFFLDEETFQVEDGLGRPIPHLGGSFDQPACMVPKAEADYVIQVPVDQNDVTVDIPGIKYGAHSFRFKVTSGGNSERAVLVPIHETLPEHDSLYTYAELLPVLFGTEFGRLNPVLSGIGPESRRSPDCGGFDQSLAQERIDSGSLYFSDVVVDRVGEPEPEVYPIQTDETGTWSLSLGEFSNSETFGISTSGSGKSFVSRGVGKPAPWPDYGLELVATYFRTIQSENPIPQSTFQIVESLTNPPPTLDLIATIYVYPLPDPESPQEIAKRLDFRITDSYHDVDLGSVTVTNLSLDPPVAVRGYYAAEQLRPEANWGWFVAALPFIAPGDNQIQISAADSGGNLMTELFTITPSPPDVVASITSPADGSSWRTGAMIPLDGSSSVGPVDLESRWVFFSADDGSSLQDLEQSGLLTQVQMPDRVSGITARLVVAAQGHLPADLYTADLPCSIGAGDGLCDSVEILLDNSCCTSSTSCVGDGVSPVSITVLSPDATFSGSPDDTWDLHAEASGGNGTYVYRWWVAPQSDPDNRTALTPIGTDGTPYDPAFNTGVFDPSLLGFGPGKYEIWVEAGYIDGTSGCIVGLNQAGKAIYLIHELSAIAPGQAFSGDTVRVYSSTFLPGDELWIRIQDDPSYITFFRDFYPTATEDGWVDFVLPSDMPAGVVYYLKAGNADSENQVASTLKQILEIVHPGYTADGTDDPSCLGGGQEAANPIVPGQTVTGDFCDAGDTDYFYFTAAAGTTIDVALERGDQASPPFLPSIPDAELFIVDPQGLADSNGYADDVDTSNPDALITGYVTPKDGLYALACRAKKGWGEYTLTVNRTATPTNAEFTVVPYGPKSVTIGEETAQALPTVSLQAILFDPQGIPAAGAELEWLLQAGTAPTQSTYWTNGWGIGQSDFDLASSTSAQLLPAFDFPLSGAKQAVTLDPPIKSGALIGYLYLDDRALVIESRLPSSAEVSKMRVAFEKAERLGAVSEIRPEKLLSQCLDSDANSQYITAVPNPCGAAAVTGIQLEILDNLAASITGPVTGLAVTDREDFNVSLEATCDDGLGTITQAPIDGAEVFLQVADSDPAFTRGIVHRARYLPERLTHHLRRHHALHPGGGHPVHLHRSRRGLLTGVSQPSNSCSPTPASSP